jgi:hypothetical protein
MDLGLPKRLAKQLETARKELSMTRHEFLDHLDKNHQIPQSSAYRYTQESNDAIPPTDVIEKLAHALGKTPNWLLGWDNELMINNTTMPLTEDAYWEEAAQLVAKASREIWIQLRGGRSMHSKKFLQGIKPILMHKSLVIKLLLCNPDCSPEILDIVGMRRKEVKDYGYDRNQRIADVKADIGFAITQAQLAVANTTSKLIPLHIPYPVTHIAVIVDPCKPRGKGWTAPLIDSAALALTLNFQDELHNAPMIHATAQFHRGLFDFFCHDFNRLWEFWESHPQEQRPT